MLIFGLPLVKALPLIMQAVEKLMPFLQKMFEGLQGNQSNSEKANNVDDLIKNKDFQNAISNTASALGLKGDAAKVTDLKSFIDFLKVLAAQTEGTDFLDTIVAQLEKLQTSQDNSGTTATNPTGLQHTPGSSFNPPC
jgi:hypothetical protein